MRLLLVILSTVFCITAEAQFNLQEEANGLVAILKKTPSYRDQVTGNNQLVFDSIYNSLQTGEFVEDFFDNFYRLAKLFFPIRDNHLGFNMHPPVVLSKEYYNDDSAIKKYRRTDFFKRYPKVFLNLDSLQSILKKRDKDSVEGIYYYDQYLTIGLYRTEISNELVGVVLKTTIPNWDAGQVAIRLYEYTPNCFRAIYGHPFYKSLSLYNNEKFRNHSLINSYFYSSLTESVYTKNPSEKNYVTIPRTEPSFSFKQIKSNIQYIRLGNFSADEDDMKESQDFYDRIKDSINASNLVIDLRDNTGGAEKVSRKFFLLLKELAKKTSLYILINNGTMSQGEIFTLSLKGTPGIKIYGQTTKGTIAYGSNYGHREMIPKTVYEVYMTDMRGGNFLMYENYGIDPDVFFKNDGDWIKKIIAVIKKK